MEIIESPDPLTVISFLTNCQKMYQGDEMSGTTQLQRKREYFSDDRDLIHLPDEEDNDQEESEVPNQEPSFSMDWKSASIGAVGGAAVVLLIVGFVAYKNS